MPAVPRPRLPGGLTTTVPREYVHRAALAEVFLTGWSPLDGDRCTVTAQWPRGHSFFAPVPVDGGRHYDSMLMAETIRQAGTLMSHACFGVPLGHPFLMWNLNFSVLPGSLEIGGSPADLRLDITCADVSHRGKRLAGMRYTATVRVDGEVVATGGARFTCTSPAVYRRLRAGRTQVSRPPAPGLPVTPGLVGRSSPFDVVLSPTGEPGRWSLRNDLSHPVLFDHPVDHVPGMVLLEAARQAVHALDGTGRPLLLTSLDSTFEKYVEFDRPCWIEAEPVPSAPGIPGDTVRVTAHQDGEAVFTTTVTAMSRVPALQPA
ncbi:ScbA/BarX family gamma-butyrolactone biosynthesis protein [Streptomyces barkulensis]|uniref:ScbA/BarX family gamma-butyrolactone biosynthesis protein n=1 Tax=Streptomyces barkulensis TaxID=1257026 RepID=UPI001F0D74F6|nr:ScbA/BarX family gamma-butyrolactone biosynthesis protein [Streptomyces barkulensis]